MIELPTCILCNKGTNEGGLNLIQISSHDSRGRSFPLASAWVPTTPRFEIDFKLFKNSRSLRKSKQTRNIFPINLSVVSVIGMIGIDKAC